VEVLRRWRSMKEISRQAGAAGRRVGFVPTMGALHEGHLSLMRRARELCDVLVVSIFVNPAQFDSQNDLERYPRDLAADADQCIAERVDYLFAPAAEEIHPPGSQTFVDVPEVARDFEGASRPGHFRGVATVVHKLLQIVQPTLAVFGQKDAQQCAVVRRMVQDLLFEVEILVSPTVRDADGLALSSRNRFLGAAERRAALAIPRALTAAAAAAAGGEQGAVRVLAAAQRVLEAEESVALDYLGLVDPETFTRVEQIAGEALLIVAARVGSTRLLDNVKLHG